MKLFLIASIGIGIVLAFVPQLLYAVVKILGLIFSFHVRYKPFAIASLIMAVIWIAMVTYGHFIGRFKNKQINLTFTFNSLPRAFDGYKIVQISDIHLDGWLGKERKIKELVDEINSLNADAVVFTGDLVSIDESELTPFIPILKQLKAKDGVFSILGNHDYMPYTRHWTPKVREEHLQHLISMERNELGWKLLMNENAVIKRGNDSIAILGSENQSLKLHSIIQRGNLEKTMLGTDGMFRLLLTHDPSHWRGEVLGKHDIPLTLSGHTHGGQIGFFGLFYFSVVLYKEHAGIYHKNNQYLYVNIGVGGTMPMRIGAPSEITVITLKSERK
jgi:predicted MPP superfamily phosphohydrolase